MQQNLKRHRQRLVCLLLALVPPVVVAAQEPATPDARASRAREEAVRENVEKVQELFALAGVCPGAKVADVGAGGGFLTVRLARAVGRAGHVYAVDVSPNAIQSLRERVREQSLDNVEIVEGRPDDPRLPPGSLDAVVVLNAYHEMTSQAPMLAHIRDALKPTGRLVMMEPTSRLVAPDRRAQRDADVLAADLAESDLRSAGFHVAELRDPFSTQMAGRHLQWLIVAHRAPGVLLSPLMQPATSRSPDGRQVVPPAGVNDDPKSLDLRISAEETRKHVDGRTAVIVDLRSDAEYRRGHIPGAISMLLSEFDSKAAQLASFHEPVVAYCA